MASDTNDLAGEATPDAVLTTLKEALFESEAKYRALVEQMPGVVYLDPVDPELDSIFVSAQVSELLGVEPAAWIADGSTWSRHVHPDDVGRVWDQYLHSSAGHVPLSQEYRMVHEDGSIKWVLELAHPIDDEDGNPWMTQGVIFDITARKGAEEQQAGRSERLASIIESQRDIVTTDLNLDAVMRSICERTQALTHAESATILMLDEDELVIRAATGFLEPHVGVRFALEGTLPGRLYQDEQPLIETDILNDPLAGPLARELGMRSVVAVGLRHHEKAVGQLIVLSREPDAFVMEDLDTLELLSVVVSSALSHAAEFESKRQQVEALARFETIYQGAAIGIALMSPEGGFMDVNPAFELMFGYTMTELRTMTLRDYTHPEDIERNEKLFQEMMDGTRDTYELEKRFCRKDGQLVWGHVASALQRGPDGEPQYAIAMVENITERKEAERQIAYLAYHDELTGLANRSRFQEELEHAIARARRLDLAVGVIFMDLDNFKLVNDSLGHVAGDDLLIQLSARLMALTRDTDMVARQSGDEFLLLLSDLASGPAILPGTEAALLVVESVARRVHELFKEPFTLDGADITITASLGIGVFPRDAVDAKSLLSHADVAMYRSKKIGPGGSVVFSTDQEDPMLRLRQTTELRKAVEDEAWVLHYQPVVDLTDGRILGVEALIRGVGTGDHLVPPGDFIPLAEEIGLIGAIGDWVVHEMARQSREWSDAGLDLHVGFNVSPRQLWSARFAKRLLKTLESAGVASSQVTIEITESTAMTDPEHTREILQSLHDAGFQIAIDDFGTGYSSLSRLKHLPVDILKIDRSFVSGAHVDRDAGTMVQAMVQLAKNLGMVPLAEGVETTEELAFLRALDCTMGQGFLFSRPVPADKFAELFIQGSTLIPPRAASPPTPR
jgi:diguanylate cyclase (GGDEF)-like protein/PAS domain S-box-containing protein